MLLITPADQRYALARAAEARENARSARSEEDRQFWAEMEVRWQYLVESDALVQHLNDFTSALDATE